MILHKSSPWAKLSHFVDYHRKLTVGLIIFALVAGAGALTAGYVFQAKPVVDKLVPPSQDGISQTDANGTTTYYSPLTGLQVADEAATKRQVTAIMIENSLDARPQSGIKPAGVVFEAIAEGGITRFLTLHQEDRPQLIGPVRSIRPYYVEWLAPFDAAIAHVGGSQLALQIVRTGNFKDIDQFYNGAYYWRATDRVAPHNVYTSFDKLDELNAKKGFTSSTFTTFPRKTESPSAAPNATKIDVSISSAAFNSSYVYDATCNCYLRSEGGAVHKDRETGQLAPKVVAVIKVPTQIGFEDGYREQMDTIGLGEATIFQDGVATQGYWRKDYRETQIVFYDKTGIPIAFNPGQTWITAIAPNKSVTWQ